MIEDLAEGSSENDFYISVWRDEDFISVQFGYTCLSMPEEDFNAFVDTLNQASWKLRIKDDDFEENIEESE